MFDKLINSIINNGMVIASEQFNKYILKIDACSQECVCMQDYLYDNFITKSNKVLFINESETLLYRPMKYYKLDKYNYIISLEYINYSIPDDVEVDMDFDLTFKFKDNFNNYTCKACRPKNFYKYYNYICGTNTELWIVGLNPEAKLQEIVDIYNLKYGDLKIDTCPMVHYDGTYMVKGKSQYINGLNMINSLDIDCIPDGLYEMRKFVTNRLNELFKILIVDNGGHNIDNITFKIVSKMKLYIINHITKINCISPSKMNGVCILYNIDEWLPNILKEAENDISINSTDKVVIEIVSDIKLLSENQINSYHVIIYSNLLTRKDAEKYCDYYKVNHEILDLIKFPIDIKILNKYILNLVSARH